MVQLSNVRTLDNHIKSQDQDVRQHLREKGAPKYDNTALKSTYELHYGQIQAKKCYFHRVPKGMGDMVMAGTCLLTRVYSSATLIKMAYMEQCWHA